MFCREQHDESRFGRIVYGEAGNLHDMTHGFYAAYQNSGGPEWKKLAGFPPMFYATHSTSDGAKNATRKPNPSESGTANSRSNFFGRPGFGKPKPTTTEPHCQG